MKHRKRYLYFAIAMRILKWRQDYIGRDDTARFEYLGSLYDLVRYEWELADGTIRD